MRVTDRTKKWSPFGRANKRRWRKKLDRSQATMLFLLARKVLERVGTDTPVVFEDNTVRKFRSARVGGIALLEKPADDQLPKRIDCYAVAVEDFAGFGRNGVKYKLDPRRILFSIRWTPSHQTLKRWFCKNRRCGSIRLA